MDDTAPEIADRIAPLAQAGASVVRVADAGHLPWWEDGLTVARAIAAALETADPRRKQA